MCSVMYQPPSQRRYLPRAVLPAISHHAEHTRRLE
jgi:hypothetical protein